MSEHLRIVVAIATTGRPAVLLETLRELRDQRRPADAIFICPADSGDVDRDAVAALDMPVRYSHGPRGASAQRNAILRDIDADADIVMILDDDLVMAHDYLAQLERLFLEQPDVVMTTGTLLADDVNGPGLTLAQAKAFLAANVVPERATTTEVYNGYGCNMAVRWSRIAGKGVAFDERLPLYSWAEDVDFSRQAAPFGRIVKSNRLVGVHRAVKNGRTNGTRFGYSQIANQLYLARKGTVSGKLALVYGARNVLANLRRAIRPEPFIDRRGRLLGNWFGLVDIVRGRSRPERILEL